MVGAYRKYAAPESSPYVSQSFVYLDFVSVSVIMASWENDFSVIVVAATKWIPRLMYAVSD